MTSTFNNLHSNGSKTVTISTKVQVLQSAVDYYLIIITITAIIITSCILETPV